MGSSSCRDTRIHREQSMLDEHKRLIGQLDRYGSIAAGGMQLLAYLVRTQPGSRASRAASMLSSGPSYTLTVGKKTDYGRGSSSLLCFECRFCCCCEDATAGCV